MTAEEVRAAIARAEGHIGRATAGADACHPVSTDTTAIVSIAHSLCAIATLLHAAFIDEFDE